MFIIIKIQKKTVNTDSFLHCPNVAKDENNDPHVLITKLCRICGKEILNGIEIFSIKSDKLDLPEKINLLLPISLDINDYLPQKLCLDCYNKIECLYKLVVLSIQTDLKLRRFLSLEKNSVYRSRFYKIIQEFSSNIASEMCMNTMKHPITLNCAEVEFNLQLDTTPSSTNLIDLKFQEKFFQSIKQTSKTLSDTDNLYNNIECNFCKYSFKSQDAFENHKVLCNNDNKISKSNIKVPNKKLENANLIGIDLNLFICHYCDQTFTSKICFKKHKLLHEFNTETSSKYNTREGNINESSIEIQKKCGHCKTAYNTKKELQIHISEIHSGQGLFQCSLCNKIFEKWSSLDIHEATHKIDKPYLCDQCGKRFKHSNNLRSHKRIHLEESKKKRHVCILCEKAFRSRFHLREHMNQHVGNKPYACEQCGKTFCKRIQLRQHKLSHGVNKYICPICSMAFNRKGNLSMHLKRHSKSDGMYTCSVCEHKCISMSDLKMHRKQHSINDIVESVKRKSTDKTVWQCEICFKVYPKQTYLLTHKKTHIETKITVECNECGKKLSSKSSLSYHKRSIHSSERPHMCQYCGESFVSKEARLIHERKHTGERPYQCKFCNMQYRCSSNLSQHIKTHLGVRPHVCQHCNKGFTRKGALIVHERIHTGVRPFSCTICNKSFTQKNDMLKHSKTHVRKSIQCEQCNKTFVSKREALKHLMDHQLIDISESTNIQSFTVISQEMDSYNLTISGESITDQENILNQISSKKL